MSALREHFVPTLDGVRVSPSGEGFVHEDGTPVDPARHGDIVYLNADEVSRASTLAPGSTGWWRAVDGSPVTLDPGLAGVAGGPFVSEIHVGGERLSQDDVTDLLRTLADAHDPPGPVEFDAGFFHRTLARWMGLSAPGASDRDPVPVWDYDFWKCELVEESRVESRGAGKAGHVWTFRVDVHRGEGDGPERYRYWIRTDARGALVGSGWLTEPPDLLGAEKERPRRFVPSAPDPALVEALLSAPLD